MAISMRYIAAGLALIAFSAQAGSAAAAEVKLYSTIGMRSVVEELGPKFEQQTGHKLAITFGLAGPLAKRVQDGETPDALLATRAAIDALIKGGKVTAGSEATLARSGVGIAMRKGAPKPDISTPDALKATLLAAKSISYTNPAAGGASGVHFAKVVERLGLAEALKDKTTHPEAGGSTGALLAKGEVELAVQQVAELLEISGIELVGPLPGDLQNITVFAGAVPSDAAERQAGRDFVKFLQTPRRSQ
jgi:molybdate transport system substrate-binding protein